MNTLFNFLTITLLTGGLFAAIPEAKADDYFSNFEKNLKKLPELVKPPRNETSRISEISLLNPGNTADGKIYARFAGASYCSNDSLTSWTCTHCNAVGIKVESLKNLEDSKTETKGFIAVNKSRGEIIISFRGSSNIQNWLVNAQLFKTDVSFGGKTYKVHNGFKNVADTLYSKVSSTLKSHLSSNPNYNVVVTGHSLGGAIADLIALKIKYEMNVKDNKLRLYTYGTPRVGDKGFARFVNSQKFTLGRFVNDNDVVPHLPPQLSDYDHHHRELWVNGMNTKVCSTESLEDPNCSLKTWYRPSVDAHRIMWNIPLGNASC